MINASSLIQGSPGLGYDGVVRVTSEGYYGTGALLYDGRAVLTAAHLFSETPLVSGTRIEVETLAGTRSLAVDRILVHPGYDAYDNNNDVALVWLADPAPVGADRYTLYREGDEVGQVATLVGYGDTGTGWTGAVETDDAPVRVVAQNRLDADMSDLTAVPDLYLGWNPLAGTQLVADFDNGRSANDALGLILGRNDTGLGQLEGCIAPGDSGGPAFLGLAIAGIASYTTALVADSVDPDIDWDLNSSFGELAVWQRVGAYQQWIDQSLRARYADAPSRPEDVRKEVPETDSSTTTVYFLLQFHGARVEESQVLHVDYATRNGTARAGEDYIATSGTLNLYPGENQAVIPVEVIGDTISEGDEVFYLDVTNPCGGTFGAGVNMLTAMRTIVNDDWV